MSVSVDAVVEVVSTYCDPPGPSGREELVRELLLERLSGHGLEPAVDAVGNVLARVGGAGSRTLIVAHMDEVGYRVRHVTEDGFLLLTVAQGTRHDPQTRRYIVGQAAQVLGRDGVVARGQFAAPSGHTATREQLERPDLHVQDFFVDVGLPSREAVIAAGVHVGSPIVFDSPVRRVGECLSGKAMDDRLMLAIVDLLVGSVPEDGLAVDLWVAGTVQEETVLHGARAMAALERFDQVIALDIGLTGDMPLLGVAQIDGRIGAGPAVVHQDQFLAYDHGLTWRLLDCAERAGTPVQHGSYASYGSDGVAFIDAGMPAALVTTPVRYPHTARELVHPSDVIATVALLREFATSAEAQAA